MLSPEPKRKRTVETRARLVAAAEEVVSENGFEALRVEQVVQRAGVAKGTFFAHFPDKDALMDLMLGWRIDAQLDRLAALPPPDDVDGLVEALMPLAELMTCERYVFDVIMRYSGAWSVAEIGAIAATFGRQVEVLAGWLTEAPFRGDIPPDLLAEGVMAFAIQAMSVNFCALHNEVSIRNRLTLYLNAWLLPGPAAH